MRKMVISREGLCCLFYPNKRTISKFETKLANYLGIRYVIGTSMGRTALLTLLKAIDLNKCDEVIIPAYICEVVPNAVIKMGGIPIFVDTNPNGYHISLSHLKSLISIKTKAIIVNHIFGYPEDIFKIRTIIKQTNADIYLIEDVAHAMGAEYMGRKVGSFGDAAIFSFTKNMIDLGGGAIATNNPVIATNARKFVINSKNTSIIHQLFFGMLSFFEMGRVGSRINNLFMNVLEMFPKYFQFLTATYNNDLKIPDDMWMSRRQACIASLQLNVLDSLNEQRIKNQNILNHLLKDNQQIRTLKPYVKNAKHVCTWYVIQVEDSTIIPKIINSCRSNHIYISEFWRPLPIEQSNYYKQNPMDVPNAISNAHSTIAFKINPNIPERDLERIGDVLYT